MDFLPPLVQELRGRATQLLATYKEAGAAAEKLALVTDGATSKTQRSLATKTVISDMRSE